MVGLINTLYKSMEKIVMIGDFGKDLDDEHALILACGMHKMGLIKLSAVIGNLHPALFRAKIIKGTLQKLGLSKIPIGSGSAVFRSKTHSYEKNIPYVSDKGKIEKGSILIKRILEKSSKNSITLVLQSGMTDAWEFLNKNEKIFVEKIKRVVIMGGVKINNNKVFINKEGLFEPNNANNNSFDMPSAIKLYKKLQQLNIPITITTNQTAYACQIPFSIYDDMEKINEIGKCLKERQKPSLQKLFEAACSPEGSAVRGTLPKDRDRKWFVNVFCKNVDPGISATEDIWPHIDSFNLYDPINLIASLPYLVPIYFNPIIINKDNYIIGTSADNHGIKNIKGLKNFLIQIELSALEMAPR